MGKRRKNKGMRYLRHEKQKLVYIIKYLNEKNI